MGETLKHSPLVEAACEFRFDPNSSWDWTVPGQLFERIKGDFPERSEVMELGVQIKVQAPEPMAPEVIRGPVRLQFKRSDGSAVVQVGPHQLIVSRLRPYGTWEGYRLLILGVFERYASFAPGAPLSRLGLRYINQLVIRGSPGTAYNIGDYVTLDPPLKGPLDRPLLGFYQRYDIAYSDAPAGTLVHQSGIRRNGKGEYIMVDLDFASDNVKHVGGAAALGAWLDGAHDRVHEAFVASLNHDLYERFRKGEP